MSGKGTPRGAPFPGIQLTNDTREEILCNIIISVLLSGIAVGGQYALIAIGYTMVYGILRLINFAHGDVFMVAGLMGIYFSATLPLYIALPLVLVHDGGAGLH